ncbi:MAG: MBL fold metallo-hydrolase [Rickettsiaceae bacterium]|nr:MBL fold metallo-hydrolase [Rickettsiaceae bacterium]
MNSYNQNFKDIKINILGCGSSLGVPVVGCFCQVCTSQNHKNKRSRCSITISVNNKLILIDSGPDIREQLLKARITNLDAVILTHAHADHINGLDDLRIFTKEKPLNIYTNKETAEIIENHFNYLTEPGHFILHKENYHKELLIAEITFTFLRQNHGNIESIGVRLGDFIYANDLDSFPQETIKYLEGSRYWVVDCINYQSNDKHFGLDLVSYWVEKLKLERIYLTNMSHRLDYNKLLQELPSNITPAYDGLQIDFIF